MRRDSLAVLFARGWASALACWKGLLVALLLNAALAFALARPVSSALHAVLDRSTFGERLEKGEIGAFTDHFTRNHPEVLGDTSKWETLATGGALKDGLLGLPGAAGAAVWAGLAMALLSALLAAGFAGRFGDEEGRGSLALFGADVGRYGLPSLLLGALSFAGIVAAYRWVYAASADLGDPPELRYEWEALGLTFLRLLAFLLVAGFIRLLALYARAWMGLRKSVNPLLALARAAAFLARRPLRALALEVLFSAAGIAPLAAWLAWGPAWNGSDPLGLALVVLGQQVVVFLRIAARTAHLGAAVAFLRRADEAAAVPARRAAPAPDPSSPLAA